MATITLAYSDNQQLPANSVKQLVSVESPSSATRPLVDLNGDGYGLSATISYT